MSIITLLHVSDVHFGVHDHGNQRRITNDVLTVISGHLSKGRSPDFCIFSGDLTQSAASEQFAEAGQWLKRLAEATGAPIFLVPGNHDVRRPPKGTKRAKNIKRHLRAAPHNHKIYNDWLPKVKAVPLLQPFFEWHEQAKNIGGVPIQSTWTVDSPFVCHYTTLLSDVRVHLIGLNTATLSCDDDDKSKLVADETALNNALAETSSRTDLVIVVTHHPIKVGGHLEQWLAGWNDKRLAKLLLEPHGPHLYLHGHLHRGRVMSTSLNTSETLTSFGAGAVYASHDSYPMKFAFYDINLTEGIIQPWMYNHERGSWFKRDSESVAVRGLLPIPPGASDKELRKRVDTGQASLESFGTETQQLRNAYKRSHEAVRSVVQNLYPTKEVRHQFKSITNHTIIHANGDATITATFVITSCSEQPLHFWETGLWADPESDKMPFIDDIELKISDLGDTKVTYLPTLDEGWEKTFCVFFLPQIKPQESRKIKLVYRWPGYAPHFLNGDKMWFEWSYKTGLPSQPVDLDLILDIDQLIGPIDYQDEGRTDGATKWKIVQQRRKSTGTRLRYQCNKGTLTGAYKVVVWKRDGNCLSRSRHLDYPL